MEAMAGIKKSKAHQFFNHSRFVRWTKTIMRSRAKIAAPVIRLVFGVGFFLLFFNSLQHLPGFAE